MERRHAVIRKACEIYLDDGKLHDRGGIREALTYVIPQQNATPTVAGFSPSQWVLGYQPEAAHLLSSNLNPSQLAGNNRTFEHILERRTAAKVALTTADADDKLRRALGRRYQGQNREFKVGERVWFWRDARQGLLNKIRWLGPAYVVLREEETNDKVQRVKLYWLAYKTQLIRAAPHHVRADILGPQHLLDDLQTATNQVRQLKSRGVTRYFDLRRVNRQQLDDVEEDEMKDEADGSFDEHDGDPDEPPRHRLRLEPPTAPVQPDTLADDDGGDYTPTSPAHSGHAPTSPRAPPDAPQPADVAQVPVPQSPPQSPVSRHSRSRPPSTAAEPSEEPAIPTPHGDLHLPPESAMALDPATASLYQPHDIETETFQQRRARFNLQETISFGPIRNRRVTDTPYGSREPSAAPSPEAIPKAPAAPPPAPLQPGEAEEQALMSQAFQVTSIDTNALPSGWYFRNGYFELEKRERDYWEVRAGCLIRHHCVPRRHKMSLQQLPDDAPFSVHDLDNVRVTVIYENNGRCSQTTDDGTCTKPPCTTSWTGATIFQIKGSVRKEYAMYAKAPLHGARQVGKMVKQKHTKDHKKMNKSANTLSERTMTPDERAMFKAAKVKELQSFFDNNVWAFETSREAQPSRTLTSRMLLKWSKHPDRSPRAKARLIVRGFQDPDAWDGTVPTSSPTTTRLSRSVLLSLAATMSWGVWTSDISTAFLQGKPQARKLWVQLPAECLQLLGAGPETRMLLLKPCYGQIDAPRAWYLAAVEKLRAMGLRQHPLDPCCFLICEGDLNPDFDFDAISPHLLGSLGVCGMIIMHVDDMLGCGSSDSKCYLDTIAKLKNTFTFREWKTDEGHDALTYCGCDIKPSSNGGHVLDQTAYMKKVKPIAYDKKRDLTESLSESEMTQLRGLLGSLQWPATQSSPHLQGSTSILSGQVTRATLQTVADSNRLLKFAKDNSDVGLCYEHLGSLNQLRVLCFFDAAFATRSDGSSQAGYIILMINKELLQHDGPEGAYHVLDWRSLKTPRVARSSLGAEAQAGGQACDALENVCVYWNHLLDPRRPLKELLEAPCPLEPTMVTDAKALYDSFHREGVGSSVVDKRVSLEVRVMKERLLSLGGSLRWMSSERQMADGLTKESARTLLAQRLRYGQLKLTWDPHYKAAKKKTKEELQASLQESTTASSPVKLRPAPSPGHESEVEVGKHEFPLDSHLPEENYEMNTEHQLAGYLAYTNGVLTYVSRAGPSHVEPWHLMSIVTGNPLKFFMVMMCFFLPQVAAATEEETMETGAGMFELIFTTAICLLLSTMCLLGRWSVGRTQVTTAEIGVQKEERSLGPSPPSSREQEASSRGRIPEIAQFDPRRKLHVQPAACAGCGAFESLCPRDGQPPS